MRARGRRALNRAPRRQVVRQLARLSALISVHCRNPNAVSIALSRLGRSDHARRVARHRRARRADSYVPIKRRATLEQKRVDEIAASILDKGLQTPILVRADGARFVLVEGLHRLEAAKALTQLLRAVAAGAKLAGLDSWRRGFGAAATAAACDPHDTRRHPTTSVSSWNGGRQKGALYWKAQGMMNQGCVSVLTGKTSNAIQMITTGITAYRLAGSTVWMPLYLLFLARAYAELDQFGDAWHCVGEAITAVEKTKERWWEAEVHRIAGEIALKSPEPDTEKAETYFERALSVARAQQAKSWELRAAMSMARLWRDHGKPQQARELLAPVYGWFTEGFDTLDLKDAKALLDGLRA
jgi:hypothetical protein